MNFLMVLPLALGCSLLLPDGLDARGAILAVISVAATSGAGYALWHAVLPQLSASVAAVAQLSVPLVARTGGLILLAEVSGLRFWLVAMLIPGDLALSLLRRTGATLPPAGTRSG